MAVLSGVLLLLCVKYSYTYLPDNHAEFPGYTIHDSWSYTKPSNESDPNCYKNFHNLIFDKWRLVGTLYRVVKPKDCDVACEQTRNCGKFLLVKGVPYGYGCFLFELEALAQIAPMYGGDATCNAETEGCVKRDNSYDRRYQIFIKKSRKHTYPRIKGVVGYAGCKKYCKTYSGLNGFEERDIDWDRTNTILKDALKESSRVPCGFYTHYSPNGEGDRGVCMIFATGATSSDVSKIAGPTPKCREQREAKLKSALSDPDFLDYVGRVFDKTDSVGHLKSIINPKDCLAACKNNDACQKILLVIGMSENYGCHMFKKDARPMILSVESGEVGCPTQESSCVTKGVTYGGMYQIIPWPEYDFKGVGIDQCQKFCEENSGNSGGFPFIAVDWSRTGLGIGRSRSIKCAKYTYVSDPWFGRQCKIFGDGASEVKVFHRINAKAIA